MSQIQPPFYETINQLLYAILQQLEENPVEAPLPPYYNTTNELLYEILHKLGAQQSITAKKYSGAITGDGSTKSFTIAHNLNSNDLVISAREIGDNLKEVFLENYPDPSDPSNKLIVSFEFAPSMDTSYKILIIG